MGNDAEILVALDRYRVDWPCKWVEASVQWTCGYSRLTERPNGDVVGNCINLVGGASFFISQALICSCVFRSAVGLFGRLCMLL